MIGRERRPVRAASHRDRQRARWQLQPPLWNCSSRPRPARGWARSDRANNCRRREGGRRIPSGDIGRDSSWRIPESRNERVGAEAPAGERIGQSVCGRWRYRGIRRAETRPGERRNGPVSPVSSSGDASIPNRPAANKCFRPGESIPEMAIHRRLAEAYGRHADLRECIDRRSGTVRLPAEWNGEEGSFSDSRQACRTQWRRANQRCPKGKMS